MKKCALISRGQLSSVFLEARSPTTFGSNAVAKGQHVIASIVDATCDVSHRPDMFRVIRNKTTSITGLNVRVSQYAEL